MNEMPIEQGNRQPSLQPFWLKRKLDASELFLEDAVEMFLTDRATCAKTTKETYLDACERFTRFMKSYGLQRLSDIDSDVIEGYIDSLRSPYDPTKEVNKRAWMDEEFWAREYTENYVSDLCRPIGTMIEYFQKKKKLPRFDYDMPEEDEDSPLPAPQNDEFDQLLGACVTERDFLLIALIGDTGLRRQEAIDANWGDLLDDRIRVIGKGNKLRLIPVSQHIMAQLLSLKETLPPQFSSSSSPIFTSKTGNRLNLTSFQSIISRVQLNSRLPFSAHSIRRYAMRTWLRAGRTLEEIREAAGHVHISTTLHYLGRFEPFVTDNSLKTASFDYLVSKNLIHNTSWERICSSRL